MVGTGSASKFHFCALPTAAATTMSTTPPGGPFVTFGQVVAFSGGPDRQSGSWLAARPVIQAGETLGEARGNVHGQGVLRSDGSVGSTPCCPYLQCFKLNAFPEPNRKPRTTERFKVSRYSLLAPSPQDAGRSVW